MEWCVEDARARWKKYWNLQGELIWLICMIIGIAVFCLSGFFEVGDAALEIFMLVLCCGVGIAAWFICLGVAKSALKFGEEMSLIRKHGEKGENVDGVIVGRSIAYIPRKNDNALFASYASVRHPFVLYDKVNNEVRNSRETIFIMKNNKTQIYFSVDISQKAYDTICEKIEEWRTPDIVYVDDGDDWI